LIHPDNATRYFNSQARAADEPLSVAATAILKRYYVLPRRYWPDNPIAQISRQQTYSYLCFYKKHYT
jgi:hypothetical protein